MVAPTVFIVDDDRGVRNSIRELLISVGLAVETFESAQSFLDAFDTARPGCLVLDVRMAHMGGVLPAAVRGSGSSPHYDER